MREEKLCSICDTRKSISEYSAGQARCKPCMRIYSNARYAAKREENATGQGLDETVMSLANNLWRTTLKDFPEGNVFTYYFNRFLFYMESWRVVE